MMRRTWMAVLIVVVLAAAACSSDGEVTTTEPTLVPEPTASAVPDPDATTTPPPAGPTATPGPAGETPTPSPTATVTPTPAERIVNVYWLRDTQLAAGGRVVATASTATAAIEALLAGPDAAEQAIGMETALPAGVELLGLTIADGTAVIDLSPAFESVSLGTFGETAMVSQIVFTLTQFPTVDRVDIRIGGEERDAILSHGLEARGLTRSGFYEAVAPGIVVERPIPNQAVRAPFNVSGFSRTFESNVQWELTRPPGGDVVASGFTTAQQPDVGVHGPFATVVGVLDVAAGPALLTVFESSAKDGSRINVYEVPIMIAGSDSGADSVEPLAWLRVNGLGPVDFGVSADDARAALTPTFGPPSQETELTECGSGASLSIRWDDFEIVFDADRRFGGWFYRTSTPAMTTPSGVEPGFTRDQVADVYDGVQFFQDTLEPEFFYEVPAGFVGGFFDDDDRVDALYAGLTCFFR